MATGRIGTTPVLQVRWSKAPTNGTTSLSGLDDNSVSLVYSVGYEAVYRNGVLLSRGNDYTATNGTTVTLIDATITGDIIEIFANQTVPLSDTFSQTVADGRFIKNTLTTTTGDIIYASGANTPARLGIGSSAQVLTVSGGIPAWAAPSAPSFVGCNIYRTTGNQTISDSTATAIDFNAESFDTDTFHDNVTNPSRVTIPAGKGGKYLFTAWANFVGNGTGYRNMDLFINGTTLTGSSSGGWKPDAVGYTMGNIAVILNLVATDYVEVFVTQTSGGNLALVGNIYGATGLSCVYLGA